MFSSERRVFRPQRPAFWFSLALFLLLTVFCSWLRPSEMLRIIPSDADLNELSPVEKPKQYDGRQLFKLINGGAGVFLAAGFEKVVVQEYVTANDDLFRLEIYRMKSDGAAVKIYRLQGGKENGKEDGADLIPQASTVEDYFGMFRQNQYYFTVTGYERNPKTRTRLFEIAEQTALKIAGR